MSALEQVRTGSYLFLPLSPLVTSRAARFRPSCLGRSTQCFAACLGADISPPRGAEAHRLTFYWRWGQFPTGNVEHLQGEIQQHLRRQSSLPHDASHRHRASDAETRR